MPIVKTCARCTRIVPAGVRHCPTHAHQDNAKRHAKQRSHGRTTRGWQRTRAHVLAGAGHRCELHIDRLCTSIATTVHRLPEHGPIHDDNLDAYRAACAHCHGATDAPRSQGGV